MERKRLLLLDGDEKAKSEGIGYYLDVGGKSLLIKTPRFLASRKKTEIEDLFSLPPP